MSELAVGDIRVVGSRRINVLHVLGAMDVGGVEMRTLELAPPLAKVGVHSHVLALSGRRGVLADDFEAVAGQIVPLKLGVRFPHAFLKLLQDLEIDVVHSHVATASGPILALAKRAGVPIRVAHFRSDDDGRGSGAKRAAQRRLFRSLMRSSATAIRGVSPQSMVFAMGPHWPDDDRCALLFDPVSLDRLTAPADQSLRAQMGDTMAAAILMHVGRTGPEKNRERLPRILSACLRAGIDVDLAVVGEMDETEAAILSNLAADLNVSDRIHFLGPRSDAVGLVAQADVMLLPSRREGLPGVALEAVGVGTPVVSSDTSGARLIQDHLGLVSICGLEAADEAWAAEVSRVLRVDRSQSARATALERMRASRFHLDSIVLEYAELYGVSKVDS